MRTDFDKATDTVSSFPQSASKPAVIFNNETITILSRDLRKDMVKGFCAFLNDLEQKGAEIIMFSGATDPLVLGFFERGLDDLKKRHNLTPTVKFIRAKDFGQRNIAVCAYSRPEELTDYGIRLGKDTVIFQPRHPLFAVGLSAHYDSMDKPSAAPQGLTAGP